MDSLKSNPIRYLLFFCLLSNEFFNCDSAVISSTLSNFFKLYFIFLWNNSFYKCFISYI